MPSTPIQLTLTDPVHTQNAMATVEEFLQRSNCSDHTKNVWLYLESVLQKLSTTQSTPPTSVHEEIIKGLSAMEKRISAMSALLLKVPLYADQACKAAPQGTHEEPVSGKALKGVTLKVIKDPKPFQTSERLVKSINAARSSKAGKVLAARKLKGGDICITDNSHETKTLLEQEEGWTQVIGGQTKVRGRRFTVIAHRVRTNRIDMKNQQKALEELQAQNPQLKTRVKFLKVAWRKTTLKDGKLYGPLLIDVRTPE